MKRGNVANDNKALDYGLVDPDRDFVADLMAEVCAELQEFDRMTVASVMLDELFRMLDANPFRTGGDEGAVRADLQFLWSLKHRILPMTTQWEKGWLRLQAEKRLPFKFNRAAATPASSLEPRCKAPPADYSAKQHAADLRTLRLRPGLDYTEREVLTRYRRRMLDVLRRHAYDHNRVLPLAAAKKRVLGWLRRSKGKLIVLEQA